MALLWTIWVLNPQFTLGGHVVQWHHRNIFGGFLQNKKLPATKRRPFPFCQLQLETSATSAKEPALRGTAAQSEVAWAAVGPTS